MAITSQTVYAVLTSAMTTLGYTATREFFDLDAVPDSIAHKSYRIGPGSVEFDYHQCPGTTTFRRNFSLWVLYRIQANDPQATYYGTILPFEDALVAALRSSDYLREGEIVAEYAESPPDYIVLQLTIPTTYKI